MNTLNREELVYLNGLVLVLEPSKAEDLHEFIRTYNNGHRGFLSVSYIYLVGVGCILRSENNLIALTIANKIQQYIRYKLT